MRFATFNKIGNLLDGFDQMFQRFSPRNIPLLGRAFPRRFHLYCVGTAKSGTHSIASVFSTRFRSKHEPYSEQALQTILNFSVGTIDQRAINRFIIRKEKQLHLEVNSSQLNYFFLPTLISQFPNSKFVLTIREPYSWLSSYINHQLGRGKVSSNWQKFRDYRFDNSLYTFSQQELILKKNHLYPLDSYLSYWVRHNQDVIRIVPQDRLLILRTNQISKDLDKIADFVGIKKNMLSTHTSHTYRAVAKFNILEQMNNDFVTQKIVEHCQPLKDEFFTS